MNPIRLLLIEDSENDAKLLLRALERQGVPVDATRIESREQLESCLNQGGWDLVISDYYLPHLNGMEALQRLRTQDPITPFILVSGKIGEDLAVEVMRAGANDFLLKEQLFRLAPAIERELREAQTHRTRRVFEEERRRLHMAIRQCPDAIIITDPEGAIVYANPALEHISGYALSELLGQNPRIFKSDRHDASFYQALWEVLRSGEIWRGLFINKRKDHQFWEAEASIAPVYDDEGHLANYVCTQRDVTHERLLQSQLEQSQRMEAIGMLASGIAHDFNNILMPILAHAELGLDRENLSPALRRDLEVIQHSAQRAGALTKQVLAYARNQALELKFIELHRLICESLKLLRAAIPSTIQFQVSLDPSSGFVRGDPTQLHQIVLNLCTNAAHAMRGCLGTLSISLRHEALPETLCAMGFTLPMGPYLVLEVADTGHGMSEDVLSRIFLPFFTTKGPGEGTGLGLSIVLGIVQGMGGGLQVTSQPDVGTSFRLFLPAISTTEQPITEETQPMSHGTGRILLVDDDTTVLAALQNILTHLGYQIVTCSNPQDALERFSSDPTPFDLLLTDLTMPTMTGLALIAKARSHRPAQRAILMTGFLDIPPARDYDRGVPDGILTKPFSMHIAAEVIRDVLEHGNPIGR
jgi:PAS domain S-box-containing protein